MEETLDIEQLDENSVEVENQGDAVISVPFNPNLIRIRRDPFTLGELIDKIQYHEVNFQTAFQRKKDLWDAGKQSRLIESVLLRLPLPSFYFDEIIENENSLENRKSIWQVIDGLQRCSAFNNFIVEKSLALTELEFLNFKDYKFDDLPRELQRRIMQTPITVYVVEKGTPEEVKFNIFKRINTGGLILTPQEIRHAMNQGVAAECVAEMASDKKYQFREATCNIIKTDRMEDQDFVTRYVAFYLQGYKSYQPDLDSFMTKGMGMIKKLSETERAQMKQRFGKAMEIAIRIFRDDAFRKRTEVGPNVRRRPINKALFEVESVVFAKMTDVQLEKLVDNVREFKQRFINLNRDEKFRYAISSGTGQKDSVSKRYLDFIEIVQQSINETIEL